MAGYIGSKSSVTQVDGYSEAEADAEFVNDPNGAITVSGSNVGIGTSDPNAGIQVAKGGTGTPAKGADTGCAVFGNTTSANAYGLVIGANATGTGYIQAQRTDGGQATYNLKLQPNGGNVLVGTTSILDGGTENAIHIQGSTSAAKWCMVTKSHSRGRVHYNTSSGGISDYFITGSTNVGAISQSTTSTSYATSSDYRLKTDAQPMTGASARVQSLNPVNFEWLSDGTRVDGFLAHEAQEVVPEAVTGTHDGMKDEEYEVTPAVEATYDEDGNELTAAVEAVMGTRSVPDYQGIDQSKLVPLLTAALQEALTEIESLKTRVENLEGA